MDKSNRKGSARPQIEREQQLVSQFMKGLSREKQTEYSLKSRPDKDVRLDKTKRQERAVDAIYSDPLGRTVAIEHTSIDPFEGARDYEAGPLESIWEPLRKFPIPEHHIWLRVARLEAAESPDWQQDGFLVRSWFLREQRNFPLAEASYEILRPSFPPFRIRTWTQRIPGFPGMVSITSWDPKLVDPSQSFMPRIKRAIKDKLPKLCDTVADRHILLLELVDRSVFNLWDLAEVIEALSPCFPGLDTVEVWATNNSQSDIQGTPSFCHLQGGQIGRAFLSTPVIALIPHNA
jgi:hypothetical protein